MGTLLSNEMSQLLFVWFLVSADQLVHFIGQQWIRIVQKICHLLRRYFTAFSSYSRLLYQCRTCGLISYYTVHILVFIVSITYSLSCLKSTLYLHNSVHPGTPANFLLYILNLDLCYLYRTSSPNPTCMLSVSNVPSALNFLYF